jgi:hypothetical protein
MLIPLALGSLMTFGNLVIQILAVVLLLRVLNRKLNSNGFRKGFLMEFRIVGIVMIILFAGHLLQFSTWAALFVYLGEFADFNSAFYHSAVNFTSLGYGDLVMSEQWRLLGALEAANGVMMFGLSAGTLLAIINWLFVRHIDVNKIKAEKAIRADRG